MRQTERLSGRTEDDHASLRVVGVSAVLRASRLPNTSTSVKSYRLNTSLGNYVSVAFVMCNVRHNLKHPEVQLSSQISCVFVMSDAA